MQFLVCIPYFRTDNRSAMAVGLRSDGEVKRMVPLDSTKPQ